MSDRSLPEIQLTRRDFVRLDQLTATPAGGEASRAVDFLVGELSRARVSDRVAANVVTMDSEVLFRDEETGRERAVTLVFPRDHAGLDGALSVLTPLGAALIGVTEGQSISFDTIDGRTRRVTVVKVLKQPEEGAPEPRAAVAGR